VGTGTPHSRSQTRLAPFARLIAERVRWIGPRLAFGSERRRAAHRPLSWPEVCEIILTAKPKTVSVDIFDTCIVRDLAGDGAIELVIDAQFKKSGEIARSEVGEAAELEMCRPVAGAAEGLKKLRDSGIQVVFVSDTDRSSKFLASLLQKFNIFVEGDELIVSCEAGATKLSGHLFSQIWPNPEPNEVWHIGNDQWADVTMAASAGLRPLWLASAELTRYEKSMVAGGTMLGAAVAGAARNARLATDYKVDPSNDFRPQLEKETIGIDVAGQSMVSFCLWVAEQCRQREVDHVAFLSRDGALPLRIARSIDSAFWDGRPLHYLHCSRLLWSLAAASAIGVDRWLQEGTSDNQAFLNTKRHEVPLATLLGRLGLVSDDLSAFPMLEQLAMDAPLPFEADSAWQELLEASVLVELVAQRSDERRKLIADYLRQESMLEGRIALVDVGWRGRLAWQVSAVLRQIVEIEPIHFHFGGIDSDETIDREIQIFRFAFDGRSRPVPPELPSPVSTVETLTASNEARVLDYRRRPDGEVELVFDSVGAGPGGDSSSARDRELLWDGAALAAAALPKRSTLESWNVDQTSLSAESVAVLSQWWNSPTKAEAMALADLQFEHDEAGTSHRSLAVPYSLKELPPGAERPARQWPQGSEAVSSAPLRAIARTRRYAMRLRSGLFNELKA